MNQDIQGGGQAPVSGPAGGTPENPMNSHSDMKSLLVKGLYAILFLIILIAALQLYFSAQEFIRAWFSDEYIPVLNTLYYLAVVAGGIYLILTYIRNR
jgi:hypothetical protein